jgi:hypothetical protein
VLLCLVLAPGAVAQNTPSVEYQVKAAYIYNFTKLIDWNEDVVTGGQLVVGIVGEDRFGAALSVIDGETVGPLRLVVRRFDDIETTSPCHVLFVSGSLARQQRGLLNALRGRGILTIGETDDFIRAGGVINFVKVRDKVHFEINLSAARQAGLEISSHLLRLAATVY